MRRQDEMYASFILDEEEEKLDWSASTRGGGSSEDSGAASPAVTGHATTNAVTPPLDDDQAVAKGQKTQSTSDKRREQNRLTVQRFYYRKKSMREEEARLTQEFAALRATISDEAHANKQSETTQLVLLKESLQHQNELLRDMISNQIQQQVHFGCAFKATHQFVQAALQQIFEHKNAAQTSSATRFSALGWDCAGSVHSNATDGTTLQQFVFSKSLRSQITESQLAQQTLEMWTPSNPMHTHLFPAYTQSQIRLLQRIDDRNLIAMQTIRTNQHHRQRNSQEPELLPQQEQLGLGPSTLSHPSSSSDRKVCALLHVSLAEVEPNGCVFFLRSISREHYELSDSDSPSTASESLEWLDVFNWCTLTSGRDGSTEVSWGIRLSPLAHFGMSAFEWLTVELARVVRWEAAVLGSSLVQRQEQEE
ncbi:hypothetical protein Gpo141_00004664 [Globisporangium polare]